MSNQVNSGYQQAKPSTRVADYFLVVGATDNFELLIEESMLRSHAPTGTADTSTSPIVTTDGSVKVTDLLLTTHVIDRYPLKDRDDIAFPEGIFVFCQPGGLRITDHSLSPSFHSFVHTSENGARVFGCCLTIYEKLDSKQKQILKERFPSCCGLDLLDDGSSCKYYLPKCLCVTSTWPFVSELREILCQVYRISIQPSAIPVERYICNLIDDVPAPVAGLVDVSYYCGVNEMEEVHFRLGGGPSGSGQPQAWTGLPLRPLFECLSVENVLTLFSAVLVERQVVFVSSQYSLLTVCAEAITSLLYPLSWPHVYVPVLPLSLVGMITAPVPYIVGLHSSFLNDAGLRENAQSLSFQEETAEAQPAPLIVYIDENRLECGFKFVDSNDEINGPQSDKDTAVAIGVPSLPGRPAARLLELLGRVAACAFTRRSVRWTEVTLPLYDSAFGNAATPSIVGAGDDLDDDYDQNVYYHDTHYTEREGTETTQKKTAAAVGFNGHHHQPHTEMFNELAIRRGFMSLFVDLLLNYRRHLVFAEPAGFARTISGRRSKSGAGGSGGVDYRSESSSGRTAGKRFRVEEFLAEQPTECRVFMALFLQSQAFAQFVSERVYIALPEALQALQQQQQQQQTQTSPTATGSPVGFGWCVAKGELSGSPATGVNSNPISSSSASDCFASSAHMDSLFFDDQIDLQLSRGVIRRFVSEKFDRIEAMAASSGNSNNSSPALGRGLSIGLVLPLGASKGANGSGTGSAGTGGNSGGRSHVKTYVPPSPDVYNLPQAQGEELRVPVYSYETFPKLDPELYAPVRGENMLAAARSQTARARGFARLQRYGASGLVRGGVRGGSSSSSSSSSSNLQSSLVSAAGEHSPHPSTTSSSSTSSSSSSGGSGTTRGGGGGLSLSLDVGSTNTSSSSNDEAASVMGCSYSCYLTILCSAIVRTCSLPTRGCTEKRNQDIGGGVAGEDRESTEEEEGEGNSSGGGGSVDLFQYYSMSRKSFDSKSNSSGEDGGSDNRMGDDRDSSFDHDDDDDDEIDYDDEEDIAPCADYSFTYVPMQAPCHCFSSDGYKCPSCAGAAATSLLRVAVETVNALSFHDEVPSDHVYRSLAQACSACGDVISALSLLVHLRGEDVVPDFTILSCAAGAIAQHNERVRAVIAFAKKHPTWVDYYMQYYSHTGVGDSSPGRSRSISGHTQTHSGPDFSSSSSGLNANLIAASLRGAVSSVSTSSTTSEMWTMLYSARMNPVDVWAVPALNQEKVSFEAGCRPRPRTRTPIPATPKSTLGIGAVSTSTGGDNRDTEQPPMWHQLLAQAYEEEKQCYTMRNILRMFFHTKQDRAEDPFGFGSEARSEMPEKSRLFDDRPGIRRRLRLTKQLSNLVSRSGHTSPALTPPPPPSALIMKQETRSESSSSTSISCSIPATATATATGAVRGDRSVSIGSFTAADFTAKVTSFWRQRTSSTEDQQHSSSDSTTAAVSSLPSVSSVFNAFRDNGNGRTASSPRDTPMEFSSSSSDSIPTSQHFPRMPAAHEVQWSWAGTSPVTHIYPPPKKVDSATSTSPPPSEEQEQRRREARNRREAFTHDKLERDSHRSLQAQFAESMVRGSGTVLAKLGLRQDPGNRKLSYCRYTDPRMSYTASQEFSELVRESEKYTGLLFPNVAIDFMNPLGTCCPNKACGQRQTVEHVQHGWTTLDSNNYASKCWSCRAVYVPQFTVFCTLHNFWWKGISTDMGLTNFNAVTAGVAAEGDHCLWCPLLSPWVLMKEVQNVLCADADVETISSSSSSSSVTPHAAPQAGISALLSHRFISSSSQNAVVFWNLIVTFKRFGLPYSILLCDNSLCSLFNSAIFLNNLPGGVSTTTPAGGSGGGLR